MGQVCLHWQGERWLQDMCGIKKFSSIEWKNERLTFNVQRSTSNRGW